MNGPFARNATRHDRRALPHAVRRLFLTDAGFDADAELRGGIGADRLAAHALLACSPGRYALARYFRGYLSVARRFKSGFVLDSPTAKAHLRSAGALGATESDLRKANREAVDFVADLRDEFYSNDDPIVLNGVIGCHGEFGLEAPTMSATEAEDYYGQQIGWLADSEVDMLTASRVNSAAEAVGIVNAARKVEVPIALSVGIGADALLPSGQSLCDFIAEIDAATPRAAAYYTIDCEHPDQLRLVRGHADTLRRIKGLRCGAWPDGPRSCEPAERFAAHDPQRLLDLYRRVTTTMPWLNVVGGRFQAHFGNREVSR
jgi:homocysteine S-methyltransferase